MTEFFDGRRVLVTGATGVKGTWLALVLARRGAEVVGLDRVAPTPSSHFELARVGDRIRFVQGDLCDLDLLQRLVDETDVVFNLAAVSLVGESRANPLDTYRSNTYGTAVVLEALRRSDRCDRAVMVTTDKVYRSKNGLPWTEDDALFATDPYPVSKACSEEVVRDYVHTYLDAAGKHVVVARAGNVLLGGDPYSSAVLDGRGHLHVDCFEALIEGRPPRIFNPAFTRPYTYGLDILRGYAVAAERAHERDVRGEAFNFGAREVLGVENGVVASKICAAWGSGVAWEHADGRFEPFEKQSLDWSKADRVLGWRPVYSIDETIADLARWYRVWGKRRAIGGSFTVDDIDDELLDRHDAAVARTCVPTSGTR
jgi:CDP-glucose 4,6-dehydratase